MRGTLHQQNLAAKRPEATAATLRHLWEYGGHSYWPLMASVARHPHTPQEILQELAGDEFLAWGVAFNPQATPELLEHIWLHGGDPEKERVEAHPRCPQEIGVVGKVRRSRRGAHREVTGADPSQG